MSFVTLKIKNKHTGRTNKSFWPTYHKINLAESNAVSLDQLPPFSIESSKEQCHLLKQCALRLFTVIHANNLQLLLLILK